MSCVFIATEALSHTNECLILRWGTVRGYGGLTVVMLSAVDGPPWTKCGSRAWPGGTIHGCRTWSGGTDCGGTIGRVGTEKSKFLR